MKLAADANVPLSALIGGQAKRVLTHPAVEEILTTEVTLAEVPEYASQLAIKRRLAIDMVMLAAATLPVTTVARSVYSPCIAEARKRIGRRDPDDVELLALAMQRGIPIWSNDGGFAMGAKPHVVSVFPRYYDRCQSCDVATRSGRTGS